MSDESFAFDVALSFLTSDEDTAQAIAKELEGRYRVFIYTEQQKELAGRDGLEAFTSVFRDKARVCVVLYRDGWGQTKWTRVEETAIKDRAFASGWDFLVFIMVVPSTPPVWLPKTKLWLSFQRFGITGALGAIEARVQECGGEAHEEDAQELVARLQAREDRRIQSEQFLLSRDGIKATKGEVTHLFGLLSEGAQAAAVKAPSLVVQFVPKDESLCLVRSRRASATVLWTTGHGLCRMLLVREFDGPYSFDRYGGDPKPRLEMWFRPAIGDAGTLGWRQHPEGHRFFSSPTLADFVLKRLFERAFSGELRDEMDE